MTHVDKKMNTIHFWSDPADIRINPQIRIRIPDQILALAESALSDHRSNLSGDNAEKLLFLACNVRLFNNYRYKLCNQ